MKTNPAGLPFGQITEERKEMEQSRRKPGNMLKAAAALVSLLLILFLIPASAETREYVSGAVAIDVSGEDFPSNDAMAELYLRRAFYGSKTKQKGTTAGSKLTGTAKTCYDLLKPLIGAVAEGTQTSTVFQVPLDSIFPQTSFTYAELELGASPTDGELQTALGKKFSLKNLNYVSALLTDCPYDLYWYDKTSAGGASSQLAYGYSTDGSTVTVSSGTITFSFSVAEAFRQGSQQYVVSNAFAATVTTAKNNAAQIVADNAGKSTYQKLKAYKEAICDLVSYNDSAAGGGVSYGNPWQLLWVFDNDASTTVVCEGYSKAFQYLCDLTTSFSSGVKAISVSGTMAGGTGAGPHMWNIVTLGGKKYLVDVTNCDTGTIGAPDKLFLAGYAGTVDLGGGQTQYNYLAGSSTISYVFDPDIVTLYGIDELSLSDTAYTSENDKLYSITLTQPAFGSITATVNGAAATSARTGDPVMLSASPAEGYELGAWTVTQGGTAVQVTDSRFSMPAGDVSVTAAFLKLLTHADISVAEIPSRTYDASAQAPVLTVKDGSTVLAEGAGKDYTVVWTKESNVVTSFEDAGEYTATITGVGNYSGTRTAVYTIAQAPLTITVKDQTCTYDGQAHGEDGSPENDPDAIASKIDVSGLQGGDKITMLTLNGQAAGAGETAISVSGFMINGIDEAADNYSKTIVPGKLTIQPKKVTVTGVTAVSRAFEPGSLTVTLSGGTVSGVVQGDTVTADLTGATGTMADADAGKNKAVTVEGVKLGGSDAGNYALSAQPSGVTVTISRAEPAVTAPKAKEGLVYTGSAQELVEAGAATGGTMNYALSTDDTAAPAEGWGTSLPAAADAGTYSVWYKVIGDENHTDTEARCISVTIQADQPTSAPTKDPDATEAPDATETPAPTKDPDATETPAPTKDPDATETPAPTKRPDATETPAPTKKPTPTPKPIQDQVTANGGVYRLAHKAKTATLIGAAKKNVTSLKINATVKANGKKYTVKAIADKACKGLKNLTTLTIGANVKTIGAGAFASCPKLKTVKGGASVTAVGNSAFDGDSSLTSVATLKKVRKIGDSSFRKTGLTSFALGAKLIKIGKNAFAGCTKLRKLTGGTALEIIGSGAFSGDKALSSVPVLPKLTAIGASAFKSCKALTKFTFSAKVKQIGKNAFLNCSALKTITFKTKILTTKQGKIDAFAFKGIAKKPTVTCPKGMKKAYRELLLKKGLPQTATFR